MWYVFLQRDLAPNVMLIWNMIQTHWWTICFMLICLNCLCFFRGLKATHTIRKANVFRVLSFGVYYHGLTPSLNLKQLGRIVCIYNLMCRLFCLILKFTHWYRLYQALLSGAHIVPYKLCQYNDPWCPGFAAVKFLSLPCKNGIRNRWD